MFVWNWVNRMHQEEEDVYKRQGEEAVKEGLIDETGGICQALHKLYELIEKEKAQKS